jgi:hypothetical protein
MAGGWAIWINAAPKQKVAIYTGHTLGQNKKTTMIIDESTSQQDKLKGKKCPIIMPEDKIRTR